VKRPLGKPRLKREVNIKTGVIKTGWKVVTGFIWLRTGIGVGFI
jgi:hypothetical protein